jgi:hypothetical protein
MVSSGTKNSPWNYPPVQLKDIFHLFLGVFLKQKMKKHTLGIEPAASKEKK